MSGVYERLITRRDLLRAAGYVGIGLSAAPILAACSPAASPSPGTASPGSPPPVPSGSAAPSASGSGSIVDRILAVDVTGIDAGKLPALPLLTNKRFDGQEVIVGSLAGPPISSPFQKFGPQWEAATGAKIKLVTFPFDDLFAKLRSGLASGGYTFDLITFSVGWSGDFMGGGYLEPVPDEVKALNDDTDYFQAYRDVQAWGGTQYGLMYDGDNHQFYYRRDILEENASKWNADFKGKYGYDLKAPDTWKEYLDIAGFFNGIDWSGTGTKGFGTVEPMGGAGGAYFLLDRGVSYSRTDADKAVFFDPDTMKPRIDEPGWIRGLEDLVKQIDTSPPGASGFGFPETRPVFISGQAVMDRDWGDIGTLVYDKNLSQIKGKLGAKPTPGVESQVYDRKAGAWVDVPAGTRAPYLAFGGYVLAVPTTAKNKDAAWDLAAFMANPVTHAVDVVLPDSGLQPCRQSFVEAGVSFMVKAGSDETDAKNWLKGIGETLSSTRVVPELSIPGQGEYIFTALNDEMKRALAKEISPEEAMKNAAQKWEQITDRLGRDKQKAAYAASLAGAG
jgi:multiple sugar transport system substrate-binding protein